VRAPRLTALVAAIVTSCALTTLAAPAVQAQIVNTQPLMSKVGGEGFAGELGASIDWRTGNVELLRLIGSLLMLYHSGDHTLIWSSSGDYGTRGGDAFIQRVFSHLRYQLRVSDLVTWEVFSQVSTARFKRLTLRTLVGTGPRWDVVREDEGTVSIGTAYMFEHETLNHSSFADSGRVEDNHRLSLYVTGRVALDDRLTLTHTTYYQPRLDAMAADFRLYSITNLAISLVKELALTVGLELGYDSEPPADVAELDTTLTFGISWGF
jgi:putative salt-induced outer membrane protein YdiY